MDALILSIGVFIVVLFTLQFTGFQKNEVNLYDSYLGDFTHHPYPFKSNFNFMYIEN
jgi:hypothetical protein